MHFFFASGYDSYFLMEYFLKNGLDLNNVLYSGSKIMMATLKGLNIRLLDSLNFLPMRLSQLPKAFGIEDEKGQFPFHFNTLENQDYIGPYPEPRFYGVDSMSKTDRERFYLWYEANKDDVFNFRHEIVTYCKQDVNLLKTVCLIFRSLIMDITSSPTREGIDPFDSTTIASTCMKIYRTKFLQEEWKVKTSTSDWQFATKKDGRFSIDGKLVDDVVESEYVKSPIAQYPSNGYTCRNNYSKKSIQWLEWLMELSKEKGEHVYIQHALNSPSGEHLLHPSGYRCDGFDAVNGRVLSFNGCFWHGCKICVTSGRTGIRLQRSNQTMDDVYKLAQERDKYIRSQGFEHVVIWEHEFDRLVATDERMSTFVKNLDVQERLDPRDAFLGGRTETFRLNYKVKNGEVIRYVDFTSLYPACNAFSR